MVNEASRIINEIKQIKAQYIAEVGKGRRIWPKSIKERVAKLDELGLPARAIAAETGISYETVIFWRHIRRKQAKASPFHELKAANTQVPALAAANEISKSVSVTVPNFEMPAASTNPRLRLTTPKGYIIDGLDENSILRLLSFMEGGAGTWFGKIGLQGKIGGGLS